MRGSTPGGGSAARAAHRRPPHSNDPLGELGRIASNSSVPRWSLLLEAPLLPVLALVQAILGLFIQSVVRRTYADEQRRHARTTAASS